MKTVLAAALASSVMFFVAGCGTSNSTEPTRAALIDQNKDKVPDQADTNGDGKPDIALGNLCQLVCDGDELNGLDIDCDGEVDFDINPIELPEVCARGGGVGSGSGTGSGGGDSSVEACASVLNEQKVACERVDGGSWSCTCADGATTRSVSYDGDDACSIPGGACY